MPFVIRIGEILVVAIGVVIIVTQIIRPALFGGKMFPGLRGTPKDRAREDFKENAERLDGLEERVAAQGTLDDRISAIEDKLNPQGAGDEEETGDQEDDTSQSH